MTRIYNKQQYKWAVGRVEQLYAEQSIFIHI